MRDLSALYDGDRLRAYSRILLIGYVAAIIGIFAMSKNMVDPTGKPLGYDFITFWSAGRLSLDGNAAGAFDFKTIFDMQRIAVPASEKLFAWHYPPTFQLVAVVLALPPYLVSYFLFMAVSMAAFAVALRPLVPWREAAILLLALPGTFVCVLHGQNSLITAALLGLALIHLDRRPLVAGLCIGLLAYKPQMAALFPFVLALTGRWKVMAAAAATVAIYVTLATLAFGPELWAAFIGNLPVVREVMETGQLPWGKMPSAFIFLRKLGVGEPTAYAAQTTVALAAAATTLLVWWRTGGTLLAGATLVTGTMLLTPYTFDYELAILAVPLAIVARHLANIGAATWEKALLIVIAATPLAMGSPVDAIGIQIGFLALSALFVWSAKLALGQAYSRASIVPAAGSPAMLTPTA
jgi:alpha-1,2-mannosyltransferase